jgi:hypothetical protein
MKTKTTRSAERAERFLIFISTPQRRALRTAAKRAKTTQQALIRAGIDLVTRKVFK